MSVIPRAFRECELFISVSCVLCREEEATLIVGDLPQGCGHFELQELFSELASVVNIRMIEHKGIAFVTVESEAEAGHIIDIADSAGLHMHRELIRVARAHQPADGPVCSRTNPGSIPQSYLSGVHSSWGQQSTCARCKGFARLP